VSDDIVDDRIAYQTDVCNILKLTASLSAPINGINWGFQKSAWGNLVGTRIFWRFHCKVEHLLLGQGKLGSVFH
jgi:hypothetical protein